MIQKLGDELIYLYKAISGSVAFSEANTVAQKAGIDKKILDRADAILKSLSEGSDLSLNRNDMKCNIQDLTRIIDEFMEMKLDEENLETILEKISSVVNGQALDDEGIEF